MLMEIGAVVKYLASHNNPELLRGTGFSLGLGDQRGWKSVGHYPSAEI